jgi:hypothetical protein
MTESTRPNLDVVLLLPPKLHFRSMAQEVGRQVPDGSIVRAIDLKQVEWVYASGLASLAAYSARLGLEGPTSWLNAHESAAFRYFQDMDFFRLFHAFSDEDFARQKENRAFARLTKMDWESDSSRIAKNLSKLVEEHARPIYNDFFTCLEESVRNVMDHARKPGFAVAQATSLAGGDRSYNVAIADYGRGVREALADVSDFRGLDHRKALEVACHKGTSGARDRKDNTGTPMNFGIGLYQIDRIAETTSGRFILASGDTVRIRDASGVRYETIPFWQGTVVEVSLFLSGFRDVLRPVSKSGKLRFG